MDYRQTTDYLFRQLPMFERDGNKGYKSGLQTSLALDLHSGCPHKRYKTIHVAGTNGKGSCSHTIAAALQLEGYKVGLYTSPHLVDFRERIKVDGQPISEDYVVKYVRDEMAFFEPLHPSFFELTTAMAFKYFMEKEVDYAVIEVGLGGRLDCTNIINPELCVITNIGFDHTQFLGNTLESIATEKAGIIKCGVPVIIGESTRETNVVFEKIAQEKNAPIIFADDSEHKEITGTERLADGKILYKTRRNGNIIGELGGDCQIKNSNTILAALNYIRCKPESISGAFANVVGLTGLMGRWQTVMNCPTVVCDTGHNVEAWRYISLQLCGITCRQMRIIFGMVNDKDLDGVINLLPKNAIYYFTQAANKRAVPAKDIMDRAKRFSLSGKCFETVGEAFASAIQDSQADDFVFVGGSSYVVADFLKGRC